MENTKETQKVGEAVVEARWPQVMVDIETLGTRADSVLLEIGAVCFDLERREQGPTFYRKISLSSNDLAGRKIDAATLSWWLDQFRERGECDDWERCRDDLSGALYDFWIFWERETRPDCEFWCRGSLDALVLEDALLAYLADRPAVWRYSLVRDHRSVLVWEGVEHPRATHGALADAISQVKSLALAADKRDGRAHGEPDFAAGWAEYREALATTQAALIPVWEQLPGEVREAYAAGVRVAVRGGAK